MKFARTKFALGFTLVELMIAMVIVAIITSIAYPSYRENIRRSDRSEVRGLMLENAQFMERFFTENSSYSQTNNAAQTPPVLPNTVSPRNAVGARIKYNITFRALPALSQTTFAIQAEPVNSMAGDSCATLTLNQLGQQGTEGTLTNGMTTETCWAR